MQARVYRMNARDRDLVRAFQRAVEARSAGGQAFAGSPEPLARIVAQNGCRKLSNGALVSVKRAHGGRFHAEDKVV